MMFWRVLWQLLRASKARLVVALLTLVSGGAVCSALISLQLDAESKLTQEFRTLGANVVVAPPRAPGVDTPRMPLMNEAVWQKIAAARTPDVLGAAPYLYVVARAGGDQNVVVAATWLDQTQRLAPWWQVQGSWVSSRDDLSHCLVGRNVARQFHLTAGSPLELRYADRTAQLAVAGIVSAGGADDNQIFVNLPVAQQLANLAGQIGVVQLSVAGTPRQIRDFVARLAAALPDEAVRPVRQIAEAEGELFGRIHLLILATIVLILVLTALGVLATMAALAMERRRDIGLMKALGGPLSRILRVFLAEVGILGALGGILGYGLGVALAEWAGRRIFGAGVAVRLEVLPLTVLLMTGVALAGALPLRLLGRVRPAVILRGE